MHIGSKTVYQVPPEAPLTWPQGWPEGVGLVAVTEGEDVSFHPYHRDEAVAEIAARVGFDERDLLTDPESQDIAAASSAVEGDDALLEAASDFWVNYDYARSEGVPLEVPAKNDAPAQASLPVSTPAARPHWAIPAPVSTARMVQGAVISRSVTGDFAINIPLFSETELVELSDIHISPSGTGILFPDQGWDGMPGTILIPAEVSRYLGAGVGDTVRVVKTSGWVSISPDATSFPLAVPEPEGDGDDGGPVRKPRRGRRGALSGLAILIMVLMTGYAIWSERAEVSRDPISDMRSQIFGDDQ